MALVIYHVLLQIASSDGIKSATLWTDYTAHHATASHHVPSFMKARNFLTTSTAIVLELCSMQLLTHRTAVPQARRLLVSFSQRRHGFNPRTVYVGLLEEVVLDTRPSPSTSVFPGKLFHQSSTLKSSGAGAVGPRKAAVPRDSATPRPKDKLEQQVHYYREMNCRGILKCRSARCELACESINGFVSKIIINFGSTPDSCHY